MIIVLLFLIGNSFNKEISIPIFSNVNEIDCMALITLGNPGYRHFLNIDMKNKYAIVEQFDLSYKILSTYFINDNGMKCRDILDFKVFTIQYKFMLVRRLSDSFYDHSRYNEVATLLLSRSNNNVLYQLKEQNKIKEMKFKVKGANSIIIDGKDNENECYAFLELQRDELMWKTFISDIKIGPYFTFTFYMRYLVFDINEDDIIVPYEQLQYFKDDYFKLTEYDVVQQGDLYTIEINKNNIHLYKNFSMILDKRIQINFDAKEMFITETFYSNEKSIFRIKFKDNVDQWIIGGKIIKQFNMIFDDDNNRVGFDLKAGNITELNNPNNRFCSKMIKQSQLSSRLLQIYILSIAVLSIGICPILLSNKTSK